MTSTSFQPIAVLGAGSWGTALALYLGRRQQTVQIWSIEASEILAMQKDRANERYLPGHALPDSIHPMLELQNAVEGVTDILVVVPSVGFRNTLLTLKPLISDNTRIICATKGLDTESGQLLSEVADSVLGKSHPFAMLSGPSFAREVAAGLPTAVVIASRHAAMQTELARRFHSNIFHIDLSEDVIGVEIGGVVKNVIAIATGMSDGMSFGTNARSAIITRGLAEITRLGLALGAKAETMTGLAGLGDLILTCSDDQSRNRRLGLAIGKGQSVAEAEKSIGQVVEGKRNAELVSILAKRHGIKMPICETIWEILQGNAHGREAILGLLGD